jgi:hypothetical protein
MGWMAPLRHPGAKLLCASESAAKREPSMSEITTIGLDLAKHVFQVHGVNAEGASLHPPSFCAETRGTGVFFIAGASANCDGRHSGAIVFASKLVGLTRCGETP